MKKEEIYQLMQKRDMRITRQKKVILSVLIDNQYRLLSVNQIMDMLEKSEKISSATVYRNIQSLIDLGILESVIDSKGTARYAIKCNDDNHHHLICLKCGKIIPISCDANRFCDISKEFGFKEEHHVFEIYGTCKDCTAE